MKSNQGKVQKPRGRKYKGMPFENMILWFLWESAERLKELAKHKRRQLKIKRRYKKLKLKSRNEDE